MVWSRTKKDILSSEIEEQYSVDNSNFVMLVDDNETDNFISRHIIEIAGFADCIEVKNSGTAALAYLRKYQEQLEKIPNIIFLDINMPTMDGFVFLYEFEKLSETVKEKSKVVILSSSDNRNDIDRIISTRRVVKFITKPLNEKILGELVLYP